MKKLTISCIWLIAQPAFAQGIAPEEKTLGTLRDLRRSIVALAPPATKSRYQPVWSPQLQEQAKKGQELATRNWVQCSQSKAQNFVRLNETARAVAESAVQLCADFRAEWKEWYILVVTSQGVDTTGDEEIIEAGASQVQTMIIDRTAAEVTAARSAQLKPAKP